MPDRQRADTAVVAYIGLGGNVGDAVTTLRRAIDQIGELPDTQLLRASRLYRTPAWGKREQADFVNAVAAIETTLTTRQLLEQLLMIEHQIGRRQRDPSERWGPRTLDLDILLYGSETIDEPGLHVPHPHLYQRAFALMPLLELVDDIEIPGQGSARAALETVADEGIEAIG